MNAAHAEYLKTRILTASPGELVVLLYDALFQKIRQSIICVEDDNMPKAGELIRSAQDILTELMASLRPEHHPDLARNLFELYSWGLRKLVEGFGKKDAAALNDVIVVLKPLRDAWVEADKSLRDARSS
jgi:flagellar protein FliS